MRKTVLRNARFDNAALGLCGLLIAIWMIGGPYEEIRSTFYLFFWRGSGTYEVIFGSLFLAFAATLLYRRFVNDSALATYSLPILGQVLEIAVLCKINLAVLLLLSVGYTTSYSNYYSLPTLVLLVTLVLTRLSNIGGRKAALQSLFGSFFGSLLIALLLADSIVHSE